MHINTHRWLWNSVWVLGLLAVLAIFLIYLRLPVDGATGDLESFTPEGFVVQWLLEEREGGLQVGDVIVRADGNTIDQWFSGAPRGPEWRDGGTVTYEILRDQQPLTLQISLSPILFKSVISRWGLQILAALSLLLVGSYVFWKRPHEPAAGVLMLLCTVMAVQTWSDAYNFQYAILTDRRILWLQLAVEHTTFTMTYASVCLFALVFPLPHPILRRHPRLTTLVVYISNPLFIFSVMALAPTGIDALRLGNRASWPMVLVQTLVTIMAGARSVRTVEDPVSRAQIRWILWGGSVLMAVAIPGYILPLAISGQPLIPHPVVTLAAPAFLCIVFAIPVLRYRLFDIELLANRSLVYGALAVILIGTYLLLARILTVAILQLYGHYDETLVTFVATLCIALASNPLRRQLQTLIDWTFYRRKVNYQRLLPEMTEQLTRSIDLDHLAELLTDELPHQLQIKGASLFVLNWEGTKFIPVGHTQLSQLPIDHPLLDSLCSMGSPLIRLQPPTDLGEEIQAWLEERQIELTIPLTVGEELVGIYNLGPKLSGHAYNREEIRPLHLLGQQAAISVQNSRLFQAEQEQRKLAEALQEAADVVSSTLDLERVLDRILEQVERVVAGDAFNIMLLEDDTVHVVRWRGYEPSRASEKIKDMVIPIQGYTLLASMAQVPRATLIVDTETEPNWVVVDGWEWQRSYVGVPIRIAGKTVGFLNVDGTRPGQFAEADARRLAAFANHAATAIENARLFQDILRQADELEEAVTRLEELDRLKSEFIQNVSHELRSPLALIRGYAELLASQELGPLQPEQLGPVEIIARRSRMLASLVDDIILILMSEARMGSEESVALDELARAAVQDFRIATDQAGLDLQTEIAKDLPPVKGEVIRLRRVLDNLLSNAIKFTPTGGCITLRLWNADPQVMLEVSDTGIGIPPEQQELIFQRFYQVDGSATRRYGGVGLGLALVKEIVEALGGTICVESEVGQGSTFRLTIPTSEERGTSL